MPRQIARLLFILILFSITPVAAQVDFPIGYSSLGGTYAFISIIEEQKLLEKDGVRPAFVYIGGPQISQALIAGDIRMAIVAGTSPVRAAAHGAEVRFIGGVTDKENITVSPTQKLPNLRISRAREWRSTGWATTVISARAKCSRFSALSLRKRSCCFRSVARRRDLQPSRAGQVHSTFVAPPLTLIAQKAGFRSLIDLADLGFPSTSASLVVMKSTAERNERELYAVMRALTAALRTFKSHRESAIRNLSQFHDSKRS
jgi:ABC-type nitrate/sulfonate/bicarbonate transport system substrate-binding protein